MKAIKLLSKWLLAVLLLFALGACSPSPTKRSSGAYLDDGVITAKVKTALIGNDQTKARQIQVETYNGVVQLSGFVDSEKSKETAEKVAGDVKGVVKVKNDLIIR